MASVLRSQGSVEQPLESSVSGVSWSAVLAGASVAAALSFSMMVLGAGMGLSSASPWPGSGLTSRVATGAVVWLILVQAVSGALGGYIAGRLRTKWVSVHSHEVYFRDTAHGFLVWAVGLVISAFFLSSLAASLAREGVVDPAAAGPHDYYVDALFRSDHPTLDAGYVAAHREVSTILAAALARPDVEAADRNHLVDLVVARTGLDRSRAEARVNDVLARDRQAIDAMRKAAAHTLYWLFAALLVGAFCGSFAATLGGKRRDLVPERAPGRS